MELFLLYYWGYDILGDLVEINNLLEVINFFFEFDCGVWDVIYYYRGKGFSIRVNFYEEIEI